MTGVAILSGVFVVYALMASQFDRLSITAPMVFVLTGVLLGKGVTDLIDVSITSEPVLLVVEADACAAVVRRCLDYPAP